MADIDITVLPSLSMGNRARDAAGLLADFEMLASAITPDWTDRSEGDPGVALAQWVAYVLDHASYQVERSVEDALMVRGSRRSAAIMLAQALGYFPDGAVAATTTLRFTLTGGPLAGALTIPKDTLCQGVVGGVTVSFLTDADLVIPQGSTVGSVGASEGSAGTQDLGTSDGSAFQRRTLSGTTIIHNRSQDTLVIKVGGETWAKVPSTGRSLPGAKVYVVRRDRLDRLTIIFGDGRRGAVPGFGLAIAAEYRTGGGQAGVVPPASITTVASQVLFGGAPVTLAVTNTKAGVGGLPRESLREIQLSAPAHFATQARAVSLADHASVAEAVSGVLRAGAARTYFNHVSLRIVPSGWKGAVADAALLASVQTALDAVRMATDVASVRTADPVRPLMSMTVTARPGRRNDVVKAAIKASLRTLYDPASHGFGGSDTQPRRLYLSDMVAAVDGTDGVDHVDVAGFTRRPLLLGPLTNGWDMAAGNASFGGASVGGAAKDEVWTLTFKSATTFEARGSVSGVQAALGTVGVAYASDGGEVAFTVTAGATPMAAGNKGRFRTAPPLTNIPYYATEHPAYDEDADLTLQVVGGI